MNEVPAEAHTCVECGDHSGPLIGCVKAGDSYEVSLPHPEDPHDPTKRITKTFTRQEMVTWLRTQGFDAAAASRGLDALDADMRR